MIHQQHFVLNYVSVYKTEEVHYLSVTVFDMVRQSRGSFSNKLLKCKVALVAKIFCD